MRRIHLLVALPLVLASCSKDGDTTLDAGPADSGVTDTPDSGVSADASIPDSGPGHCLQDQGGPDNRGCEPGFVCNLAMNPPACVAGKTCTSDNECDRCFDLDPSRVESCGHGYSLTAWCDPNHDNVCTRSRAPCEPCEVDADCGRQDPLLGAAQNRCVTYEDGGKFCGRPCTLGCPQGFTCNADGMCVRPGGCAAEPVICPTGGGSSGCPATGQICNREPCPGTGGAACATNDLPGALGLCIGFCNDNSDCPADLPVCNRRNGVCVAGCTPGGCPGGQVCHVDGFCGAPCEENADCEANARFGPDTYCNLRNQNQAPRYYKGSYRDEFSCAPLGCERKVDCGQVAGFVCDATQAPPACVPGCNDRNDCRAGDVCKSGPQGNYTREQCRALANKTNDAEIGVCCNPGCTSRVLQCRIGEFCCGEEGSPYEDPSTCLTLTSTSGVRAQPGQCFEMGAPNPWCVTCDGSEPCPQSGWTPGYNRDPRINNGQPFNEQEICVGIAMNLAICGVTCNPDVPDNACPGRWGCGPIHPRCLQDADCNGLPCIRADTSVDPPVRGYCKCGENGAQQVSCPTAYANFPPVDNPRCDELSQGDMVCVAAYNCRPAPPDGTNYPAACGF